MKYQFPQEINSDLSGYNVFIDFYIQTKNISFDKVILDFSKTTWFDANLAAILGAILNKIRGELNTITIQNMAPQIQNILRKNQFLSSFGTSQIDYYRTTVKYKKFKTSEDKFFKEYLDNELLTKKDMPDMSSLLRKKINESIFEIYNNAKIHGRCSYIFSCGQYYPQKKKLNFTIVDLGTTIKKNVETYLKKEITGKEAIIWAVKEGNTTRKDNIPGGLGLSLIHEFLKMNKGKIQIISANGFWEQNSEGILTESFEKQFPGTIANLEFNTKDNAYYYLAKEIDMKDLF
jgi:anti-anti-sigma regulatory factor